MDAANVDLKGFTEDFYHKLCGAHLQPVLETLVYLKHETKVWFEITTLLIPGQNDSERELEALTQWVVENLGPDVPLHFTAFHPDWKMLRHPADAAATLTRARAIARRQRRPLRLHRQRPRRGARHDLLPRLRCAADRPRLVPHHRLEPRTRRHVPHAAAPPARACSSGPGTWGAKRQPVRLLDYHA